MTNANASATSQKLSPEAGGFLSRLIRKHSRLLIFLGALIVFITFIIREGLREHLKDLVDSIDSAQGVFVVEQENQQLSQALAELYRLDSATYTNVLTHSPNPGQITLQSVELHWQATYAAIQRLNTECAAARRLLIKVPHEKKQEDDLERLQTRTDAVANDYKDFIPGGDDQTQPELERKMNTIWAIEHKAFDLETNLQTFTASLLTQSLAIKNKNSEYFEASTWVSYLLYAIGWGMGLIGKLYGLEGVAEDT
jgi:hypothetical protein